MRITQKESNYIRDKKGENTRKERYNSLMNFFYGSPESDNLYEWIENMRNWNFRIRNNE